MLEAAQKRRKKRGGRRQPGREEKAKDVATVAQRSYGNGNAAEQEKKDQLQKMYMDLVEQGKILGDWDMVEPQTEDKSWTSFFACAPGPKVSKAGARKGRTAQDFLSKDEKKGYWGNYDITTSLKPNLLGNEERDAAIVIRNAIRRYLAMRKIEGEKNMDEQIIFLREITKIQKHARRILAQKLKDKTRLVRFKEQELWKEYKEFLVTLLTLGIPVLRWKHSANCTQHITFKVDKSRKFFVLVPVLNSSQKTKKVLLKDVYNITKGYNSTFLRDLKTQVNPEKHLSLIIRDSRRGGKETSIDMVFDTGEESDEGRVERDKFYSNFRKLLDELEGDNAFFFSINGQYGRVSRSVFDRWERITLKSPSWRSDNHKSVHSVQMKDNGSMPMVARYNRATHSIYEPLPLDPSDKPQNVRPVQEQLIYRSLDKNDELLRSKETAWKASELVAARWFSETIEIDYKEFLSVHRDDEGHEVAPKRLKERYFLQLCTLPGVDITHCVYSGATLESNQEDDLDFSALPRLPDGRYELQPQTLQSLPISKRFSHQHHNSSLKVSQQPIVMPAAALLPYFRKQVEKQFGELDIHGWRNVSTGEFEFDDENWLNIEEYAIRRGGPKARNLAQQLRKERTTNGHEEYDDEILKSQGTDQSEHESSKTKKKKSTVKKTQIGKQRRELLRCLYGGEVTGQKNRDKMYTSAIMTYNSSMKMKFEETQRKLARQATERQQLHDGAAEQSAKLAGVDPNQKESVISEEALSATMNQVQQDDDMVQEFEEQMSGTDLQHAKNRQRAANFFRSHASVEMRRMNKDKREAAHNDDGFRFELVILEKNKRPRRSNARDSASSAFDSPVGIEVVKIDSLASANRDKAITFGHVNYPVALFIVGLAEDTVPTVQIAYSNGNIRKGDIIVGVNFVFPNSADDLIHLMKDSTSKRKLTLLRLTDPPELTRILHNKKILTV